MKARERQAQGPGKQRAAHRDEHRSWPRPQQIKAPTTSWSSKTMHHPAFRIGEIKHGKQ